MSGLIRKADVGVPRLFDSFFGGNPFEVFERALGMEPFGRGLLERSGLDFRPTFEVKETPEAYTIKADLPGVKEEDVKVTMTGNVLRVEGHRAEEREEEKQDEKQGKNPTSRYHVSERAYGAFVRSFALPDDGDAEKIDAAMKDGVLTLTIAKKPELKPRTVPVSIAKK